MGLETSASRRTEMEAAIWQYLLGLIHEACELLDFDSAVLEHLTGPNGQQLLQRAIESYLVTRSFGPEFTQAAQEAITTGVLADLREQLLGKLETQLEERMANARRDVLQSDEWQAQLHTAIRQELKARSWWQQLKSYFGGTV